MPMPSKQLIIKLPPAAQEKLRMLDVELEQVGAIVRDSSSRLIDIRRSIERLKSEKQTLQNDRGTTDHAPTLMQMGNYGEEIANRPEGELRPLRTFIPPPRDTSKQTVRISEIENELAVLLADQGALQERSTFDSARMRALGQLMRSASLWLESLPESSDITPHAGGDRPSRNREITRDLIEKKQLRLRELAADLRRIDAAPHTSNDVKERARREIEQLAESGRPIVHELLERRDGNIVWPWKDGESLYGRVTNSLALVAWLHRDDLIAGIDREIDAISGETQGLTDTDRGERFKAVLIDMLDLEREEEALIQAATFPVVRRGDADPRAVLGLSSALPGPKRGLAHEPLIEAR